MKNFYTQQEKEFFKELETKNKQDLNIWNAINILIPIFIILTTIGIVSWRCSKDSSWEMLFNTIYNGSLPLLSINLMVATIFHLFKINKDMEMKVGISSNNIRMKLLSVVICIIFLAFIIYISQALYTPFDSYIERIVEVIIPLVLLFISWRVFSKFFLLQDVMIEKSFKGLDFKNEGLMSQSIPRNKLLTKKR